MEAGPEVALYSILHEIILELAVQAACLICSIYLFNEAFLSI